MMFCRPCGREHRGPECPVDESGRPSPTPGLVPAAAANTAPPRPPLLTPEYYTASGSSASTTFTNITFAQPNIGVTFRPPDDDGLAGVPALVRR